MPEPRAWSKALRLPKRGSDLRHGGHGEHMRHTVPGFAPAHIEPSQQARPFAPDKSMPQIDNVVNTIQPPETDTSRRLISLHLFARRPWVADSCHSLPDAGVQLRAADSQGTLSRIRQAADAVPRRQNSSIRSGAAVANHRHSSIGWYDAHLPSVCIADSQYRARCRQAAGVVVIAKQLAV